ncbi:MAG TPA: multidrug effflux MFS transporter [Chakrabartia sp.]|jgi:DHA1 family bicyclomycin/chloramphenicol resistance-like MFS transporter|nr:multidrug effflux MFS transporter [Chakrabartia sp.]
MPQHQPLSSGPAPGKAEFILLIALIMMSTAFAIDSMLPVLPEIGRSTGATDEKDWPLVISAFLAGFGVAQLFVGVLADRYGRRPVVLISLIGFALANVASMRATGFDTLLLMRAVQGLFAAGARVVVTSIVRDRYEGREMAQVMSIAAMLFMAAPILAPALGAAIVRFGPWQWIFGGLALLAAVLFLWIALRLPESLHPENRTLIEPEPLKASARTVLTDRMSLGYTLAQAAVGCGLFGFLNSVQPIFDHAFHRPDFLPTGFALMACGMAVASLLNASIVRRYGMRRIGHIALFWFTAMAGIHMAWGMAGRETLASFILLQTLMMLGFALMMGNFNAMAMEKMGSVAGMASSLQGSLSNMISSVFGILIGRAFDGTTVPLYTGFFLSGLVAIVIVYITEQGRFFTARHPAQAAQTPVNLE